MPKLNAQNAQPEKTKSILNLLTQTHGERLSFISRSHHTKLPNYTFSSASTSSTASSSAADNANIASSSQASHPLFAVPEYFLDPISKQKMTSPVITPQGDSYEQTEIEKLIEASDLTIEKTQPDGTVALVKAATLPSGEVVTKADLIPNLNLRDAIAGVAATSFGSQPEITCQITYDAMQDPVVALTGVSFERTAIEDHINTSHTDPLSKAPLTIAQLRSNKALKAYIEATHQPATNPVAAPTPSI